MTRQWPPFFSPPMIAIFAFGAVVWTVLLVAGWTPVCYALLAIGVLLTASLYGNGRDRP